MPNNSTPKLKKLGQRLLAEELDETDDAAIFRVCEKIHVPLVKLMGVGGFHSLLSRARAMAGSEIPWLLGLEIAADGSLVNLGKLAADLDAPAVANGEIALVAQLLGLLVIFIGPALTLQLVHDVWPEINDLQL